MSRKAAIFFSLLSIIVIGTTVMLFSNYVFPWQKKNAIETTLNWAGLSKLPVNGDDVSVIKKGSMFTRQFVLEFETTQENIENWIKTEVSFRNISFTTKNNRTIYNFHPGKENSFGGTITIQNNKVLINMSWS